MLAHTKYYITKIHDAIINQMQVEQADRVAFEQAELATLAKLEHDNAAAEGHVTWGRQQGCG